MAKRKKTTDGPLPESARRLRELAGLDPDAPREQRERESIENVERLREYARRGSSR